MEALCQAPKIIFELQKKRGNEKITKRKVSFPTYNFFKNNLLFESLLLSNLITF